MLEEGLLKCKKLLRDILCILWNICTTLSFRDAILTQKPSDIKPTGRPDSPACGRTPGHWFCDMCLGSCRRIRAVECSCVNPAPLLRGWQE